MLQNRFSNTYLGLSLVVVLTLAALIPVAREVARAISEDPHSRPVLHPPFRNHALGRHASGAWWSTSLKGLCAHRKGKTGGCRVGGRVGVGEKT